MMERWKRPVRRWFVRKGVIRPRVLVVCTGNTCRSPMAAAIIKARWPHLNVTSAGTTAHAGEPAATNAIQAIEEIRGIGGLEAPSLAQHTSTPLKDVPTWNVDLILAMTQVHAAQAKKLAPEVPVVALSVSDPYGAPLSVYRSTLETITEQAYPVLDHIHNYIQ